MSREGVLRQVELARRSGDPEKLSDALLAQVSHENNAIVQARLHQEIGCIAYFDLDDPERARQHLDEATRLDPGGLALEAETLTALEGLYEQTGEYNKLAEVYAHKLQRTEAPDMRVVYRLLLAQLCLERLERFDEAREHVTAVLELQADHEPALRLLAEIEQRRRNPAGAADCLERLLAVGEGAASERGEILIALASLREELGEHGRAKQALVAAAALELSPTRSLEKLKSLCRRSDDWEGLLEVLRRELAEILALAHEDFTLDELGSELLGALPSRQEVGAAQLLREIADVLSLKLERNELAWRCYGLILELTPEDPYVLERHLELSRQLAKPGAVIRDLERLAGLLIEARAQFECLLELATLVRSQQADSLRAASFLRRAIALFDDPSTAPPGYGEATQRLREIEGSLVSQFSLGSKRPLAARPPRVTPVALVGGPERERGRGGRPDAAVHSGSPFGPSEHPASAESPSATAAATSPASPASRGAKEASLVTLRGERWSSRLETSWREAKAALLEPEPELARIEEQLPAASGRAERVAGLLAKATLLARAPESLGEALVSLRAALALDANHIEARLALVDALLSHGELDQGLNHLVVLVQRLRPQELDGSQRTRLEALVEVIAATGEAGVAKRAVALRAKLGSTTTGLEG